MTSLGRGRGRGILPNMQVPAVVTIRSLTPNLVQSPTAEKITTVTPPIPAAVSPTVTSENSTAPSLHVFGEKLISLRDEDSLLPLILDIINDSNATVETVNRMIEIIIDRCMWLPTVSKKYAALLSFLASHKVYGKDIRCFTFNALQKFYEDRELLLNSKKYGESTFRNAVILTGEIFYRYRYQNNRYNFLSDPVLTYLKMLLNSTNETDLLTLVQQLSWSGRAVAKVNSDGVHQLMLDIRHKITVKSPAYSEKATSLLLLCLELDFQPLENFSESILSFYRNLLGEVTLSTLYPPSLELDNHLQYYNSIRKFFD